MLNWRGILSLVAVAFLPALFGFADEPPQYRSPVDLALAADGSWLVTANQAAGTATLLNTESGKVIAEVQVGRRPQCVTRDPDGRHVWITAQDDGDVVKLRVDADGLKQVLRISTRLHPHGIAIHPDGKRAFVALRAADQVAELDLVANRITRRIDVGRLPTFLALSADGNRLVVAAGGDRALAVVDTESGTRVFSNRFAGINPGHLAITRDGGYAYFPWMVYRKNPITVSNIQRGWVLASRIARIRMDKRARREAMSLDPRGKAIADPHGLALTPDEQRLVVSAGGTHELLVYRVRDMPLEDYGGSDHIPGQLLSNRERFYRVPLGGRPLGLRVAEDNRTVYVVNYLLDAVQVVDLDKRAVVRTLPLTKSQTLTDARRGEAIFFDGARSLDQWYSCHSCHQDGGGNVDRMDTLNDGSSFTFKTVLPLYNVSRTGPWTWHGWQQDLESAMHKSITSTMLGPPPSQQDVRLLVEYLKTLRPPANPFRQRDGSLSAAAQRGRRVFEGGQANCASCHHGPYFTDGGNHEVGLSRKADRYPDFNTPSLLGVHARVRLLHDGRAASLKELLTGDHSPAAVSDSKPLADDDLSDLIEYLKTL